MNKNQDQCKQPSGRTNLSVSQLNKKNQYVRRLNNDLNNTRNQKSRKNHQYQENLYQELRRKDIQIEKLAVFLVNSQRQIEKLQEERKYNKNRQRHEKENQQKCKDDTVKMQPDQRNALQVGMAIVFILLVCSLFANVFQMIERNERDSIVIKLEQKFQSLVEEKNKVYVEWRKCEDKRPGKDRKSKEKLLKCEQNLDKITDQLQQRQNNWEQKNKQFERQMQSVRNELSSLKILTDQQNIYYQKMKILEAQNIGLNIRLTNLQQNSVIIAKYQEKLRRKQNQLNLCLVDKMFSLTQCKQKLTVCESKKCTLF